MRCGNRIYKGHEIPFNAKVHTSPQGLDFYISGFNEADCWIRYIGGELIKLPLKQMTKYL